MTQFPSEKHISSWAGICPGNNRSAGKNRSSHTTGGNRWLRGTLTECAWAATAKKNCFIKAKFWRITTKSGGKKAPAVVAIAHTLLILIYQALHTGQSYQDKGLPVPNQCQKQRMIRHHIRRLGKLGIAVYSPRSGKGVATAIQVAGLSVDIFVWDQVHDRYLISNLIGVSVPYGFAISKNPAELTTWCRLSRKDRDDVQREYDPAAKRHGLVHKFRIS